MDTETLELDLYPFKTASGAHVTIGLAGWAAKNNPGWTMTFAPREGYEQDRAKYPRNALHGP